MKLKDIARYVTDKVSSDAIGLENYVTTDSILQNKAGRVEASNLPPTSCTLTRFQKGDILIANIRPYLRKIWLADIDGGCNADVLVFRAINGYSSAFVYAVLMQDSFYIYAMKGAKGSKMPRGDKEQIMRFEVPSNLQDTDEIGYFIVAIKAKIDLLNQINRNLEAVARQLYDYWFVQFDFPDSEGKPYKSSGGTMEWNNVVKQFIPQSWKVYKVKDLLPVITGKQDANFATKQGKYKFFTCSQVDSNCDVAEFEGSAVLIAGNGDFNVKHYTGLFNAYQRTYVLVPPTKYYAVIFMATSMLLEQFKKKSNGSIIKFITKGDVENISFFDCGDDALYQQLNNLFFMIEQNNNEIELLTKQRDELLPLLMNGQVSVRPTAVNCDLSHD